MSKWVFLFLLTFTSFNLSAQTSETENDFLQNTSTNLLNRTIYFDCKSGSLDNALIKLLSEQNISISYSYDRVQEFSVKAKLFQSESFSKVLDYLLSNTGLNYILVGKIIVIVPEDKQKAPEKNSDTIIKSSDKVSAHIYKPNQNLEYLPYSERRKIHRHYKEELRWAAKFNREKDIYAVNLDSINKERKKYDHSISKALPPYYFSLGIGFTEYTPKYKNNEKYNVKKELNFSSLVKSTPMGSIELGLHLGNFLVGTGFEVRSLKVNGYGSGLALRSRGGRWEYENLTIGFSDVYHIFSIPIQVSAFTIWKRFVFSGGIKTGINIISPKKVNKNKFSSYVEYKYNGESYSEEIKKITPLSAVKANVGYLIGKRTIAAFSSSYSYNFPWFTKNTVYTLYPNGFTFELSVSYFFGNNDLNNLLKVKK
ncbi:MAG: STN domain-containing protein [Sporocytophaga sp.]|uniref:STN domain-containing protein n=1 Tax=Sporocytophaga sp. TaxID=2231183 RepID=UPI001B2A39AB|nr:STN domain-containing protein [Sporocytophaga sp.]MBO9702578.1 STN domain-containing protein [Sporocytophaga sp.]